MRLEGNAFELFTAVMDQGVYADVKYYVTKPAGRQQPAHFRGQDPVRGSEHHGRAQR